MIKLLYHVSVPMYILRILLLRKKKQQNKTEASSSSKCGKYLLTYCIHKFPFDKYCLNPEKSQAAETSLCGTGERDCKGSFQVVICKGKEIIALTFVISMRPTLMHVRLKRSYGVVKGWARWAVSYCQPLALQQGSLCWGTRAVAH